MASGDNNRDKPAHLADRHGLPLNRQQQQAVNKLAEADPDAVLRVMRQWMQDPEQKSPGSKIR